MVIWLYGCMVILLYCYIVKWLNCLVKLCVFACPIGKYDRVGMTLWQKNIATKKHKLIK